MPEQLWKTVALDPPRAHGQPVIAGRLRVEPEDFVVEEDLGFAPSGSGPHQLLRVRKRDANTQWVARQLAELAKCRPLDVGYAGLKDRRAIAIQWFSVPVPRNGAPITAGTRGEGFEVLEAHAHSRKLPRGALAANTFCIRIREAEFDSAAFAQRIAVVQQCGVPNYFGPQRFGRDGANLTRIAAQPRDLHPGERGFVLSAARSLIFNAVLAERVRESTWGQLESGDLANLDGRGSVFRVETVDDALRARCAGLEIHPTGPMWGEGDPPSEGRVRELEVRIASQFPEACALVSEAGMTQERRSLRLAVRSLEHQTEGRDLVLRFKLTKGSFATTVLRELMHVMDADEE
ncbi:MAG TPA: tRNA pseudouridine(13) synthase TruD [Steroidobacteraceae bacterium]